MVDHEEMRNAYNRSIESSSTDYFYLEHCNNCKTLYKPNSGYQTTIYDGIASYTLWYCDACPIDEKEQI